MRYIVGILWIACLWACNPKVKNEVSVSGRLNNYKGNKVYLEIPGRDSLVKAELDTAGYFIASLSLDAGTYVRLMNGKAAFPLYLAPGMKVRIEMDAARVKNGEYESVVFPEGINKETCMMIHYYENQWFPSTEELFIYPPVEFRELMDTVVAYNDGLIDDFLESDTKDYDRDFVNLFKLQVKVPLAVSYLYYPVYHTLLNPDDKSEIPEGFNIFDKMLPKNDSVIYNKVYRYKTYEVSYWNNKISQEIRGLTGDPEQYFNAWFDGLVALNLCSQIADDVAHTFIMQHAKEMGPEAKAVVKNRYEEVIINPGHRKQIEKFFAS